MKNSTFQALSLTVILLSVGLSNINGQLLNNKVNIYLGYTSGAFLGNEFVELGSFKYPSLFANFKSLNGIDLKALIKTSDNVKLGVGLKRKLGRDWSQDDNFAYLMPEVSTLSIHPTIQYHSRFIETGIFNRVTFLIEASPLIGNLQISQSDTLQNGSDPSPSKNNNFYFGINASAGLEVSVSQLVGVYFLCSGDVNWIKSTHYIDEAFATLQFHMGVVMKFQMDKRFFY